MSEYNLSFTRYTGNGSTTSYTLASGGEDIGYLRTDDIYVYVDGSLVPSIINPQTPHIVTLSSAPPSGSEVLIRREMPKVLPYADFARGNNFGQRQVNNSFLQQLYLTQELLDGFVPKGFYMKQDVNFGGNTISNLGEAVEPDDAVNKAVTDSLDVRVSGLENATPVNSVTFLVPFIRTAAGGESSIATGYNFNYCELSINGIEQTPELAFNYLNGTIFFAEPLEADDEVFAKLGSLERVAIGSSFRDYRYTALAGDTSIPVPDHAFTALFVNGIYQAPSYCYVRVGNTVQLAEALEAGDIVDLWYVEAPIT